MGTERSVSRCPLCDKLIDVVVNGSRCPNCHETTLTVIDLEPPGGST